MQLYASHRRTVKHVFYVYGTVLLLFRDTLAQTDPISDRIFLHGVSET